MRQHLFDEQAEDDYEQQLRVNEDFARRFEHNKRREELHRLQEKHPEVAARLARQAALQAAKQARGAGGEDVPSTEEGESESSSEEEEEDDLEDDTDKVLETLVRIKRHDPVIYEQDTVLFPQQQSDEEADQTTGTGGNAKKSSKPVFLRTVLAQQALAGAADEEDADGAAAAPAGPVSGSYASEQAALKAAFLAAADEADAALQVEGLVARKAAAAAAHDDAASGQHKEKDVNQLLGEYFGPDDAALDPADAFLKAYLANKAWKQPVNGGSSGSRRRLQDLDASSSGDDSDGDGDDNDAAAGDEEDEEFLEQVDRFEAAYNFRYEEPGAAKIQSFPRVIADSVRRKDERRKRSRDAKAAREAEEKAAREAELRRLKNLKKDEIQDMLSRIQQEAGIKAAAAAGGGGGGGGVDAVLADLLEGDFDPEEYDKRMAAAFSDSYYKGSDDEDELFGDGEEELADESDVEVPAGALAADEQQQQQAGGFAALRQKQKEQQQQQQEEDAQAMAEQRGQLQRLLEDYYKLDYEDSIGGLPCRFRYRQVEAENFGLTADDVLTLSEKQLNSVVGLKLLAPYRDTHKKLRPNYKALQELKGEAAAAAAKRQSRKDKKRKRQGEGAPPQTLQVANGQHNPPGGMQLQGGQQQEHPQQQQRVKQVQQKPRQHDGMQQQSQHSNKLKPSKHQMQQSKKQKQQASAELTAEEKQAARLASYAKLSLKPNKEQQQKLDSGRASGSKHAKKKRKLDTNDDQQQKQPPSQPGRLASMQLAGPLTKAQKKNLLRALKRKEKQQQDGQQ